jgi:hypothetical protein
MNQVDDLALIAVAYAGEPCLHANPSDDELVLFGCLAALERALLDREWEALETYLTYVDGDIAHPVLPTDQGARADLVLAAVTLGWHHPAEVGEP